MDDSKVACGAVAPSNTPQSQLRGSFPHVPVELVRYILETAVHMDRRAALCLALISRTVNDWITPLIYHTVMFDKLPHGMQSIDDFTLILRAPRANATVGATLRRLILLKVPWKHVEIILECPNLETLMTDKNIPYSPDPPGSQWPSPTHVLLVSRVHFQIKSVPHSVLRNVTHFYVDYPGGSMRNFVAPLSHLTHIGIGCWSGLGEDGANCVDFVRHALSQASLQMVVVQAFAEHSGGILDGLVGWPWTELAEIEDERLIVGLGLSNETSAELVVSGKNLWDDAEWRHQGWRGRVVVDRH